MLTTYHGLPLPLNPPPFFCQADGRESEPPETTPQRGRPPPHFQRQQRGSAVPFLPVPVHGRRGRPRLQQRWQPSPQPGARRRPRHRRTRRASGKLQPSGVQEVRVAERSVTENLLQQSHPGLSTSYALMSSLLLGAKPPAREWSSACSLDSLRLVVVCMWDIRLRLFSFSTGFFPLSECCPVIRLWFVVARGVRPAVMRGVFVKGGVLVFVGVAAFVV